MAVYTTIKDQYTIDQAEYPGLADVPFGEVEWLLSPEKSGIKGYINAFLADKCRLIGIGREDRVLYNRQKIYYTDVVAWAKMRYNKFVKPLIQSQYKRLEGDMIAVILSELKQRNPFLKVNQAKFKIAKKVVKRTLKRYLLSLLADNIWWDSAFNLPFLTAKTSHDAAKIAMMLLDYDTDFRPYTKDIAVKENSVYDRCSMYMETDFRLGVDTSISTTFLADLWSAEGSRESSSHAYERSNNLLIESTSYYEIITTYIEHYDSLKRD